MWVEISHFYTIKKFVMQITSFSFVNEKYYYTFIDYHNIYIYIYIFFMYHFLFMWLNTNNYWLVNESICNENDDFLSWKTWKLAEYNYFKKHLEMHFKTLFHLFTLFVFSFCFLLKYLINNFFFHSSILLCFVFCFYYYFYGIRFKKND